jgi:uncharacterized lipoprotein NlpE involved in copper resistance
VSEGAQMAFIAFAQLIALALVTAWITSRKEKRDYARQDEVAERVATAAKQAADAATLLVQAQKDTIARTDEVARLAEASDKRIVDQLTAIDEQGKKIHILVNSDMTAARTNERDSMRLLLVALRQVQATNLKLGIDPAPGRRVNDQEDDAIKKA